MKLTLLMGIEKNNFLPFAVYLRNVDKRKWTRVKLCVFGNDTLIILDEYAEKCFVNSQSWLE